MRFLLFCNYFLNYYITFLGLLVIFILYTFLSSKFTDTTQKKNTKISIILSNHNNEASIHLSHMAAYFPVLMFDDVDSIKATS